MPITNTSPTTTPISLQIGGAFAGWCAKVDLPKVSRREAAAPTNYDLKSVDGGEFGHLEFGDLKFTSNIAEPGVLLDWIQGVLRRDVLEKDGSIIVADVNLVGHRAMDFTGGHIVCLEFSDLDAKAANTPFSVDVTLKPRSVKYRTGTAKIAAPQAGTGRPPLTSNYRFQGLGDEIDRHVVKVLWPTMTNKIAAAHYGERLLPDYSYSGFEIGPLTIEVAASAYPAIEALMTKLLFNRHTSLRPLRVEMLSTDMTKTLLTIDLANCLLQEVDQGRLAAGDTSSTIKLKFSTEEIKLNLSP